jgi:hypothetical protein
VCRGHWHLFAATDCAKLLLFAAADCVYTCIHTDMMLGVDTQERESELSAALHWHSPAVDILDVDFFATEELHTSGRRLSIHIRQRALLASRQRVAVQVFPGNVIVATHRHCVLGTDT